MSAIAQCSSASANDRVVDSHPLTPGQLGLLYDVLSEPGSNLFVERVVCPLSGSLDVATFIRVWQTLVSRHGSLRSGFTWEGLDVPTQVVHREAALDLQMSDWSSVDPVDRAALLEATLNAEGQIGFEFQQPPLMRVTLAMLGGDEYLLIWSSHHLVLDGWSCWVLLSEAALLYLVDRHGMDIDLPPAPSFGEYARWAARATDSPVHREYWRGYLAGFLPARMAAPRDGRREFRHHRAQLTPGLTHAIAARACETRSGLNALLQGAWALVVADRQGGDAEEATFGTVFSGRTCGFPEADRLVGVMVNLLPVRVPLPRQISVAEWLRLLQRRHADMLEHECCTLHQVQRWAQIDASGPLFDTVLVVMNVDPLRGLPPLGFTIGRPRYLANASYPLGVNVTPGREMSIEMLYDVRHFSPSSIEELRSTFAAALALLAEGADARLGVVRAQLRSERRRQAAARRPRVIGRLDEATGTRAPRGAAAPSPSARAPR